MAAAVEVERVVLNAQNAGLAEGLNELLWGAAGCRARHALILEEDWMYMDVQVATQVCKSRKGALPQSVN